jgi:endonuclease/exonuclease/phosphatase (EEP) superfamily protein YafD
LNRPDLPTARIVRAMLVVCGLPAALATWGIWGALCIGSMGTRAWPFDLFANFRVQYMGLFAVCVVALTIARWRKTALLALVGVAYTTATMASYFPQRPLGQELGREPEARFRLVTFNTWFRNEDLRPFAHYLQVSDADVVVLQEVDVTRLDELAQLMPAYPYRTVTPEVRRVLAIFSRWPIEPEHMHLPNEITRMSHVNVAWQGTRIAVFGAHLSWPLGERNAWARAAELRMLAARARAEAGPVIVAGDFNLTPWSGYFERFVADSGLSDCAIGQGLLATWPSQVLPVRIRIDHCFASRHWRVNSVKVGPNLGSDHFPVIADLDFIQRP